MFSNCLFMIPALIADSEPSDPKSFPFHNRGRPVLSDFPPGLLPLITPTSPLLRKGVKSVETMTKVQIFFLATSIIYVFFKVCTFLAIYLATFKLEKVAMKKKRVLHSLLGFNRVQEEKRHAKAYQWYNSQKERAHIEAL